MKLPVSAIIGIFFCRFFYCLFHILSFEISHVFAILITYTFLCTVRDISSPLIFKIIT